MTDILTLQRNNNASPDATYGQFFWDGRQIAVTIELPWRDNQPKISCIPAGEYTCIPHNSLAHPHTWEISGVPNRSEILIHNLNLANQSLGCVGCGDTYGTLDGQPAVLNSVATMAKLRTILPPTFTINVIDSQ